jgi:hypothetical protein
MSAQISDLVSPLFAFFVAISAEKAENCSIYVLASAQMAGSASVWGGCVDLGFWGGARNEQRWHRSETPQKPKNSAHGRDQELSFGHLEKLSYHQALELGADNAQTANS